MTFNFEVEEGRKRGVVRAELCQFQFAAEMLMQPGAVIKVTQPEPSDGPETEVLVIGNDSGYCVLRRRHFAALLGEGGGNGS